MRGSGGRIPLIVRMALFAFPKRFRSEFESDMRAAFEDGRAMDPARRSAHSTTRLVIDLVRSGMKERLRPAWRADREYEPFRRAGGRIVEHLAQDFGFAVRSLSRRPAFTGVAMVTLALGIGANTAIFSLIDAVLLRRLPYGDADELVRVWVSAPGDVHGRGDMSQPDVEDIASLPAFASLVGERPGTTVIEGDEPRVVSAARVTNGLLSTFELEPYLGRDIEERDNNAGSALVVVLGHRFWQDHLGGKRDVIGTTIRLTGLTYEVVGVAPPGFDYPEHSEMWVARRMPPGCGRGCHTLFTIGRLSKGATLEAAAVQVASLGARLSEQFPASNFEKTFRVVRLADDDVADVRSALWFILGAVSLVLLIACANVANLLLVRGETRRSEVAIRSALGAGRWRLASQVLMECVVLAIGGAACGLLVAMAGISFVKRIPAGVVPRAEGIALNGTVLGFTMLITVVVAVLFGLGPALRQARSSAASRLVSERRAGDTRGVQRSRSALLAAEVALSLLLLVGAGLVFKSFDRLYRVDLGFEPDHLTRFHLAKYGSIEEITGFYTQLEERLAAVPGVESVGSVFAPPLYNDRMSGQVLVEGRPEPPPGEERYGSIHAATPGYASTVSLRVLRGRWLEETDRVGTVPVAVISQELANEVFPGGDPIGKRFRVTADFGYGSPVWTVVGVAGDVRHSPMSEHRPDLYVPLPDFGPGSLHTMLRVRAGMSVNAQQVRSIVQSLDPSLPVRDLETVDDALALEVAPTRFYLVSLAAFALIAVVLASVGLYGVVAYLISRRTREIGIRMALGARQGQVVGMVLRQGMVPAVTGLVVGLALALVLGRVAESLLFQVSPRDPAIMLAVTLLLAAIATVAVLLPARRASRVHPVIALRTD
jgi:putative ABC transport system permease protein